MKEMSNAEKLAQGPATAFAEKPAVDLDEQRLRVKAKKNRAKNKLARKTRRSQRKKR